MYGVIHPFSKALYEQDGEGNVLGELRSTGIVPGFLKDVQARGIELPIELFRRDDQALFARR